MNSLWLIFFIILYTTCCVFRDKFLGIIYRGYHLCFLLSGGGGGQHEKDQQQEHNIDHRN